jgi:argininosuccinate synthase
VARPATGRVVIDEANGQRPPRPRRRIRFGPAGVGRRRAFRVGRPDLHRRRRGRCLRLGSHRHGREPSWLALIAAHADLESITHERDLAREKQRLEIRYAELIYDGLWFSPLRQALDAFIDETQRFVTGDVRLHLEPGSCQVTGRRSEHSLYDYGLATYDAEDVFRHEDSAGFVRLWGLGLQTWAAKQGTNEP